MWYSNVEHKFIEEALSNKLLTNVQIIKAASPIDEHYGLVMYFLHLKCFPCLGYGGKKGAVEKCPICKGRGVQVLVQQIGPSMVQQIQTVCPDCKGQGERINPKDRCTTCNGNKVVREKKIIEIHIDKGNVRMPFAYFLPLTCAVNCSASASDQGSPMFFIS